jgi:hypothetical protein
MKEVKMTNEFQELTLTNTEAFINLQDHEIFDLCRMYYYFKLLQTIGGKAIMLTHFQMSCGAILVKICKKTPDTVITDLVTRSAEFRDFIQHELITVVDFIKTNGTEKDLEEYL